MKPYVMWSSMCRMEVEARVCRVIEMMYCYQEMTTHIQQLCCSTFKTTQQRTVLIQVKLCISVLMFH